MNSPRQRSLRRIFASVVLTGDILVGGFTALAATDLTDISSQKVGLSLAFFAAVCVLAMATLRRQVGYVLGWLAQGLLLLAAAWVPGAIVVGVLFLGLWLAALISGGRADRVTDQRAR
ncbi:MAG: DUF4233 domain-containing protein [Actinomycetota bacterium]